MKNQLIFLALLAVLSLSAPCSPFGLRIYYGDIVSDPTSTEKIAVYFNTRSQCPKSYIRTITSKGYERIECQSHTVTLSANMGGYVPYVQKCSLSNIVFGEPFAYAVYGGDSGMTARGTPYKEEWIGVKVANPTSANEDVKVAVIADWSTIFTKPLITVTRTLRKAIDEKGLSAVVIAGDIAYDLDTNRGVNYVDFLILLEKISKSTPIVVVTGNHEHPNSDVEKLFSLSFKLYGLDTTLASGLSIGSLFLLPYDPYFLLYGKPQPTSVLNALKLQLQKGAESKRYIIPFAHFPVICSAEYPRCESNRVIMQDLFDAMIDSGVSLQVGAHTHSYERSYPYYKTHTF